VKLRWRESRSMVATRWPTFIRATATCIAVVDLPEPPFSLPSTTTCADAGFRVLASTNMTPPQGAFLAAGEAESSAASVPLV
jgi:hypothetical protein